MSVHAEKNYFNLRFGDLQANPYLERVFPLMDEAPALLSALPDFGTYEAPKKFPLDDVRNARR
jgi:hypothetical protein